MPCSEYKVSKMHLECLPILLAHKNVKKYAHIKYFLLICLHMQKIVTDILKPGGVKLHPFISF